MKPQYSRNNILNDTDRPTGEIIALRLASTQIGSLGNVTSGGRGSIHIWTGKVTIRAG